MRLTLRELVNPQPPVHIHCDNATATGIDNVTVKNNYQELWKCAISNFVIS